MVSPGAPGVIRSSDDEMPSADEGPGSAGTVGHPIDALPRCIGQLYGIAALPRDFLTARSRDFVELREQGGILAPPGDPRETGGSWEK